MHAERLWGIPPEIPRASMHALRLRPEEFGVKHDAGDLK